MFLIILLLNIWIHDSFVLFYEVVNWWHASEILAPLLLTNEGKLTHRRGVCVSVTVVYRKVGHPDRRYDRITGCSRKQGLLSVQHSTLTLKHRCPENLKPTTNHTLKNHLLCLRWECVGLRTWDQIKTSKNIAWIVLFLWAQSCFGEAHTERPVVCIFFFSHCLGEATRRWWLSFCWARLFQFIGLHLKMKCSHHMIYN